MQVNCLSNQCEEKKIDFLESSCIGIVGARRPACGVKPAFAFGSCCPKNGLTVVSGLALGCDTAAHAGCLESGGKTIAVLPCGRGYVAPISNRSLARRIPDCLVSEYPSNTPPRNFRFVERNRVISALSRAAIVIEAEERSDSLHTARFALEQNKVLACYVPESGPVSSGCLYFLENRGATPLRNAADLESFLKRC